MIGRLVELLSGGPAEAPEVEQQRIAVATCVLLLELAHADGEFDASEQQLLEELVTTRFELDAEARQELLELAQQKRQASVDLYAFTRVLNDNFTAEEKQALVKELWHLVYSDGQMHHHEEYLVRRISDLLHIPHRLMIAAKLEAAKAASR
ncbi:MAG: TerB family tellurite resistance protein [Desulfuromonas sp.]|nr:MAG: TerB family tellurite resistance protein [Desulfuromonas sp.]